MAGDINKGGTAKSGWCLQPLTNTEQHSRCKRVFVAKGYDTWTCPCKCGHVGEEEASKGIPDNQVDADIVKITRKALTKPVGTAAAAPKKPDNRSRAEKTKGA